MKKKSILFFSVETGLAHITRSLAVAEELQKRGFVVSFASAPKKQSPVHKSAIRQIDLPPFLSETDFIDNIERLKNKNYIAFHTKRDLEVLKQEKPDCVVIDFHLPAIVAAALYGKPTFFLSGSGGLPYGCRIPNPGIPAFIHLLLEPLLQRVVWKTKYQFLKPLVDVARDYKSDLQINDLLHRMEHIVPELEGYLSRVEHKLKVHYTAPILWRGFNTVVPPWLAKIKPNGKTIYLTFGGTGFDGEKLVKLAILFVNQGFTVIVSTSSIADVADFPTHERLYVERYLPGDEVVKKVDLVVCHGGYGTLMQAVLAGKPTVSIPFNPDQLLHSLRIQELGLGRCLVGFDLTLLTSLSWKKLMDLGKRIAPERVYAVTDDILRSKQIYEEKIERYRKQFSRRPGYVVAADVIERSLTL